MDDMYKDFFQDLENTSEVKKDEPIDEITSLKLQLEALQADNKKKDIKIAALLKNSAILLQNLSSLYLTAKDEISSKDQTIMSLKASMLKQNLAQNQRQNQPKFHSQPPPPPPSTSNHPQSFSKSSHSRN